MLKSLLRVRFAALLAAFTGQSRKRKNQTKGKAVGYALLMLYCFCAFVFLFYSSFSQLAAAFFPAGLGWLYFRDVRHHGLRAHVHRQCLYGKIPAV